MSRIGRLPITIPANVNVDFDGNVIVVKGPLGTLSRNIDKCISLNISDGVITLERANDEKDVKAKHGLYRALIANMVKGVSEGFTKILKFKGVGYKLNKNGNKLVMDIGFSHPKTFEEVEGITLEVVANDEVAVKGIDNELVGKIAAQIRALRPVEPYHMYGIRYKDEVVIRKVSKSGKK